MFRLPKTFFDPLTGYPPNGIFTHLPHSYLLSLLCYMYCIITLLTVMHESIYSARINFSGYTYNTMDIYIKLRGYSSSSSELSSCTIVLALNLKRSLPSLTCTFNYFKLMQEYNLMTMIVLQYM